MNPERLSEVSMKIPVLLVFTLAWLGSAPVHAAIFTIDNIRIPNQASIGSEGVTTTTSLKSQIEVTVRVSQDAQSKNLVAKAYFFDAGGRLIQTLTHPSVAQNPRSNSGKSPIWPNIVSANASQSIYFSIPANLPESWCVVVVFGNANGVVAASVPDGQEQILAYPERDLVTKTQFSPDVELTDAAPTAPLIEQKVDSDNPRYPAFTLLMHLPHGVTDPRDVTGVLAVCLVADSADQIRDHLNAIKPAGDPNPYFAFAESHKMAVVAWGARWVWNSYANFDELDKDQIHSWDDNFQSLADAWDRGISLLVHNYGIPDHDYLMYGLCAGGEWVHRLALHKPDRFLAVQMHISTSYDAPTPEASHIMWLLTTGELDGGADRARRFYAAARDLNYPIIFKAFMGLGHGDAPAVDQLGIRFFEYALAEKAKRDATNAGDITKSQATDLSGFEAAPYYGDLMNQNMFAAQDKDMIPASFLVPLPSKEIADAWNK